MQELKKRLQGGKIQGSSYEPPPGMLGSIKRGGKIQNSDYQPPPGLLGSKKRKLIGKLKEPTDGELQQPAVCPGRTTDCPNCEGKGRQGVMGWVNGRYYAHGRTNSISRANNL